MNAFLQAQAALIAAAAQTGPDMTEAVKGGGGGRLLPEGYAFAQLVGYVEGGNQPQDFEGQAKAPAPEFTLTFALSGSAPDPTDPTKTIPYNNDDGTPYIHTMFPLAMSRNEKAGAFLLFKAMNWKGTATHFAQLLGEKFLVKIIHHTAKAAGSKPKSIIDKKSFLPPLDVVSRMPYPIADAPDSAYKLFLWDHPTIEAWNSLFIAGQFDAKDGKPAESKNRIQEYVLSALNFSGSPLELLLKTSGTPYVVPTPKPAAAAPAAPAMAAPAAPPAAPAAIPVAAVPAPAVPTSAPVIASPAAAAPSVPFDGGVPVAGAMPAPVAPAIASPAPVSVASPSVSVAAPVATPAQVAVAAPSLPGMPAMPTMPAMA